MFWDALGSLDPVHAVLLFIGLAIAFGFEFVNGFHDTANAVATVIYTKALPPWIAVAWSGIWNFLGVMVGGTAVAFSIVHLLPVDLLADTDTGKGLVMVLSLLLGAILWNAGTWYLGIPASSSHTLIGAILGVGLMNAFLAADGAPGQGVNWGKAGEVMASLLISPFVGFLCAGALLKLARRYLRRPELYRPPEGDTPPPFWIRAVLVITSTGVSFAHGSNDGQKGMGLIMLILIGTMPFHFALDPELSNTETVAARQAAVELNDLLAAPATENPSLERTRTLLQDVVATLAHYPSPAEAPIEERWSVRGKILDIESTLAADREALQAGLGAADYQRMETRRKELQAMTEYVPAWVILGVALSLGCGTMVGWRRIVITVGERIGKTHLSYAQGACAEVVAMCTIGLADVAGLPVSTTHVLSSGVAGTMAANRSGLQMGTVRSIALAWLLTIPAAMLFAGGFYGVATLVGLGR